MHSFVMDHYQSQYIMEMDKIVSSLYKSANYDCFDLLENRHTALRLIMMISA